MRWNADDLFGIAYFLLFVLIVVLAGIAVFSGCAVDKCSLSCQPKPLEVTISVEVSR